MLYRVPLTWGGDKLPWKLAHAGAMLLALVLAVVGLCAVFQNHATNHIPPLYSLHSWVGICSVFLFATQVGPRFGTDSTSPQILDVRSYCTSYNLALTIFP